MKKTTSVIKISGITISILLSFLLTFSTVELCAQCCNFTNSGQNLDSLPTFGVALGDLNGDGDVDAFTIDAYVDIKIFSNNGSGLFTLSQTITPTGGEENNMGVHLADLDNDGDLDAVVVPFYNSTSLKIYKNNGAGTFTLFQSISSNIGARYAGIADVDGDNDLDIVLPGWMGPAVGVFKNNGSGYFTVGSALSLVNFGSSNDIAMADFDGDGDQDAVVVSSSMGGRLLLNNGTGTFTDAGITLGNISDSYHACAAGDLDKDGDADMVFGCMYGPLTIIRNDGAGNFTILATYPGSNYDMHIKLVDYDYDGDPDIFVSTYGSNGLEVWSNDGEANLSLCYENVSPMPGTYSHGFDVGKINGDAYYDTFMGQFGGDGDKVFFGAPGFSVTAVNASICQGDSYTFPDGFVSNIPCMHVSHFLASNGCDSNIVGTLTVTPVNVMMSLNQVTFTAQAANASWQWINCTNGFLVIPNATAQTYTATQSGSYAVIVTQNGCSDTSQCLAVIVTGIENANENTINIFPNPVDNVLNINAGTETLQKNINISDLYGRVLLEFTSTASGIIPVTMNEIHAGIYIVQIRMPHNTIQRFRFVKQ